MSTSTSPLDALRAKESAAAPQPQAAPQPPAAPAGAQDDQDADNGDSSKSDEDVVADKGVNLHRSFSKLQESVTAMLDGLGVKRSATVKHIDGETMAAHIQSVHQALQPIGGMTKNLATVGNTVHGSGETVLHPSEQLRQTIVPAKFEPAEKAIQACRSFVSKCEGLIGETPETRVAKSQLAMLAKRSGAQMTAFDLASALLVVPAPVIRDLAKKHSAHKHSGKVLAHLTGANSKS